MPAASSGLALLQAGSARLDAAAARGLAVEAPVEQVVAAHEVALGAAVLRTDREVLGGLLDVRA